MLATVREHWLGKASGSSWVGAVRALAKKMRPYPPPSRAGSIMNRMEQALVRAAADGFFPPGGPIPLSGTEAGILEYFEGYVGRFHGQQRVLLRLLLVFTELSPVLFGPAIAPFTRLSQQQREQFLDGASHSRIYFRRLAFTTLRAVMTMGYLNNEDVARHIGFQLNTNPFGIEDAEQE